MSLGVLDRRMVLRESGSVNNHTMSAARIAIIESMKDGLFANDGRLPDAAAGGFAVFECVDS